jgi:effector-binding domain-containing protein
MKILKGLGIVVVLLLAIYLILALFGPAKMHVERQLWINQKPEVVFNEINTLKQWKNWSYWDNIDPNMVSTYEGPESGVGAVHKWESTNDSVGKGSLTIKTSTPNTLVECDLSFEGMGTSTSGWALKDTANGTLVTVYMDGETPFLFRPMMLFMDMDAMLGADFEKTLAGLKKHTESLESPTMMAEYVMEEAMTPAMKLLTIADSAMSAAELGEKLGGLYGEIMGEMEKQKLTQAGPVLAIYDKVEYSPNGDMKFWFKAGVPVDKAGKNSGRVMYWENTAGNAIKCDYYGDYSNTGACHEAIDKYITDKGKTINGAVWEVYVTDPGAEPDTAKWLTEIYYPVQ